MCWLILQFPVPIGHINPARSSYVPRVQVFTLTSVTVRTATTGSFSVNILNNELYCVLNCSFTQSLSDYFFVKGNVSVLWKWRLLFPQMELQFQPLFQAPHHVITKQKMKMCTMEDYLFPAGRMKYSWFKLEEVVFSSVWPTHHLYLFSTGIYCNESRIKFHSCLVVTYHIAANSKTS